MGPPGPWVVLTWRVRRVQAVPAPLLSESGLSLRVASGMVLPRCSGMGRAGDQSHAVLVFL